MNLSCGRNPWKRACLEDSTYRAFSRNPRFLSSILPISEDLNLILGRIFERDPRRRIGIRELRDLIVRCPTFTTRPVNTGLQTPPPEKECMPQAPYESNPPSPTSCPVSPNYSISSTSSLSDSASDISSNSSLSSVSSQTSRYHVKDPQATPFTIHSSSLQEPTFTPQSIPQGSFFNNCYPYPCRPIIQYPQHSFIAQVPVVC